jgi:hypothetical protein
MPLPQNNTGLSPASSDLGLGGTLATQVAGETEEQRKKRMAELQQQQLLGPAGSMSVTSLFGSRGSSGAGY